MRILFFCTKNKEIRRTDLLHEQLLVDAVNKYSVCRSNLIATRLDTDVHQTQTVAPRYPLSSTWRLCMATCSCVLWRRMVPSRSIGFAASTSRHVATRARTSTQRVTQTRQHPLLSTNMDIHTPAATTATQQQHQLQRIPIFFLECSCSFSQPLAHALQLVRRTFSVRGNHLRVSNSMCKSVAARQLSTSAQQKRERERESKRIATTTVDRRASG